MTMRISVIIPVYNVDQYLCACIDSVLSQRLQDFELLLIDDGSTDGSPQICDRYAAQDPRIRVIHTLNQGVSTARNLGLDNARGEFVVFIDADDWVEPDHLQRLTDTGIGEQGIAFTSMIEDRSDDGPRMEYTTPDAIISGGLAACTPVLCSLMRLLRFGWTCNKMFSRITIEKHRLRFDTTMHHIEDELFTAQYCKHITHISCSSYPTYHYRYVPTSLLHKGVDPLVVVRSRKMLIQEYLNLGYDAEVIYIAARTQFSRMRKLIRRSKRNSETAERLTDSLLESWEILREYSRPAYRKNFYDTKVFCLGWLICGPSSRAWVKTSIKSLRL